MSKKSLFVENVERRHWDIEEFEKKAIQKQEEEEAAAAERGKKALVEKKAPLKRRDFEVDLTSKLGKYQVITNSTPLEHRGGYYCKDCECLLKDSMSYLDHINGKKHQRALGMSMAAERATLAQVRDRLKFHKERLEEQKKGASDIQAKLVQFEEALKDSLKRKSSQKGSSAAKGQTDETDGDPSDDRRKRNKTSTATTTTPAGTSTDQQSASTDTKPPRDSKPPGMHKHSSNSSSSGSEVKKEKKTGETEGAEGEEEAEVDPMMKAMGFDFGSFGGSKKPK